MKTLRCPAQVQIDSHPIWNLAGTGVEFGASPPPESRARRRLEKGGAPVPAKGPVHSDGYRGGLPSRLDTGQQVVASIRPCWSVYLFVADGPGVGRTFRLVQRAAVIGRGEGADIILADPSVSRRHAMLTISGESVTITDLGSRNGTFLGIDRVLAPAALADGETISLGDTVMMLKISDANGRRVSR